MRMLVLACVAALAGCTISPSPTQAAHDRVRIVVRVLDYCDQVTPVHGALVASTPGSSSVTDATGTTTVMAGRLGEEVVMRVSAAGYLTTAWPGVPSSAETWIVWLERGP